MRCDYSRQSCWFTKLRGAVVIDVNDAVDVLCKEAVRGGINFFRNTHDDSGRHALLALSNPSDMKPSAPKRH